MPSKLTTWSPSLLYQVFAIGVYQNIVVANPFYSLESFHHFSESFHLWSFECSLGWYHDTLLVIVSFPYKHKELGWFDSNFTTSDIRILLVFCLNSSKAFINIHLNILIITTCSSRTTHYHHPNKPTKSLYTSSRDWLFRERILL